MNSKVGLDSAGRPFPPARKKKMHFFAVVVGLSNLVKIGGGDKSWVEGGNQGVSVLGRTTMRLPGPGYSLSVFKG